MQKNIKMRIVQKSSNIRSFGFDHDPGECGLLGTMYVEFHARPGVIYHCPGVPVELHNGMVEQDRPGGSVGSYFARQVRPHHKFVIKEG